MDNLEKFIRENKSKFREPVPQSDIIWKNIEGKINRSKRFSMISILKIAASIIVLLGSFAVIQNTLENNRAMKSYELVQLERTYTSIIQVKMQEIDTDQLASEILEDFRALQKIQKSLIDKIGQLPLESREFLLEALKNNYESQVGLLDVMAEQNLVANSIKKYKNEEYTF